MAEKKGNIEFYNKVAKFPRNSKASKAISFLEGIKIPRNRLWYFIIEKQMVDKNGNKVDFEEIQTIKYNNKVGFNLVELVRQLKEHYKKTNNDVFEQVDNLIIEGNDKFSLIKNIPNVEINGKKLISILTEDLIKLLYK
jgi:hypothetical protein